MDKNFEQVYGKFGMLLLVFFILVWFGMYQITNGKDEQFSCKKDDSVKEYKYTLIKEISENGNESIVNKRKAIAHNLCGVAVKITPYNVTFNDTKFLYENTVSFKDSVKVYDIYRRSNPLLPSQITNIFVSKNYDRIILSYCFEDECRSQVFAREINDEK